MINRYDKLTSDDSYFFKTLVFHNQILEFERSGPKLYKKKQ